MISSISLTFIADERMCLRHSVSFDVARSYDEILYFFYLERNDSLKNENIRMNHLCP